jgi:CII-binding regulator of phage lambda lysogenization HflD
MYGKSESLDNGYTRLKRKREVSSFHSEQRLLPREYNAGLLVLEQRLLSSNQGIAGIVKL